MCPGNAIFNSTTLQVREERSLPRFADKNRFLAGIEEAFAQQIYGCGFNAIFAGNTLKHMYVTEKCVGSSGLSIFGIDYQVRPYACS